MSLKICYWHWLLIWAKSSTSLASKLLKPLSSGKKIESIDPSSKCLPDCSNTFYEPTITVAPFRRCDSSNFGVSRLCNVDDSRWVDPTHRPIEAINIRRHLARIIRLFMILWVVIIMWILMVSSNTCNIRVVSNRDFCSCFKVILVACICPRLLGSVKVSFLYIKKLL